ncbi:hypothetical protein C5F51_30540 [Nocardia nova]|uniref:Mce/MlaD domain-containing protein n=2 Tax=Nocardia nova TaxID=37330 RepID=A0A2S5ZXI9_9NOCA|nr:hypothetical protein C5F51_30540 [Nocardia nova]
MLMALHLTRKRALATAAAAVVLVTAAGVTTARTLNEADTQHVCALFKDSFGLYPGSPVTIRGIAVGTVRAIEPDGARVRVDMKTDRRTLPAGTGAVITNSSILTDRRVELVNADSGPGPALPSDTCIDTVRTRTPVTVSDALASFSGLVRTMTERGPDGTAPLESALRSAGGEFAGMGPVVNRELRSLADLLAAPDTFMARLGELLDNSAELTTFVTANWDDVKTTLQTFAPGLHAIQDMLIVAKILVEKLSHAVDPLNRLFHEHFPYLMNVLRSTLPVATMVRTRTEQSADLLAKIPGIVQMLQTTIAAQPGTLAVDIRPPRTEVATPDPAQLCAALAQLGPDACTVRSGRSVSIPLPELVLSTIGATP